MAYKSIEDVKRQMERYCAYQERSHFQVEKKLRELKIIPEAVDAIVVHLIQNNFLNEERFARTYARGKFYQNKWGKLKIVHGLRQHHIHQNLINIALTEIAQDDYYQTIKQLIEKKCQQISGAKSKKKPKIIQYLHQRGYAYEDYFDILKKKC